MAEDFSEIVSNIRACILSSKGPLSIQNLSEDYKSLMGSQIPYGQFSYSTLEDFLRSLPSLVVCGSGTRTTVKAASSSDSHHITDLVSKQKSNYKKFMSQPQRKLNSLPSTTYNGRGSKRRYSMGPYQHDYSSREKCSMEPYKKDYSTRKYNTNFDKENQFIGQSSRYNQSSFNMDQLPKYNESEYTSSWDQTSKRNSLNFQIRPNTNQRASCLNENVENPSKYYQSCYEVDQLPKYNGSECISSWDHSSKRNSLNFQIRPTTKRRASCLNENVEKPSKYNQSCYEVDQLPKYNDSECTSSWEHRSTSKRNSANFFIRRNTHRRSSYVDEHVESDRKVLWSSRDQSVVVTVKNFK